MSLLTFGLVAWANVTVTMRAAAFFFRLVILSLAYLELPINTPLPKYDKM